MLLDLNKSPRFNKLSKIQVQTLCGIYCVILLILATIKIPDCSYNKNSFYFDCNFSQSAVIYSVTKIKHIIAFYFLFKILFFINQSKWKSAIIVLTFSASIEFIQAFIPYRTGALQDLLPNLVGIILSWVI
jgi:VanZ family protein